MADMETLGDRLRQARLDANLTQESLAKEAGVSKQAISAIENDVTKQPGADTLDPICRRLNLRLVWLITGRGQKHLADGETSQHLGFDFDKIIAAQKLLREYALVARESPDIADDPKRLRIAYKVVDLDSREPGSVLDMMKRLSAALSEETDDDHKRREAAGTGKGDGGHSRSRAKKA